MRAQLPLVIAVTLLVFVITTTLFYMTSTLTHTSSIWMKESEESTWRSINEQLDSVIISAISGANETAYMAFKQKWGRQVMSYNDINQSSITYVRRCGRSSITYYTIYDYTSFVRPGYLTRDYDGVGVWYALNNFAGILYNQTLQVDYANAISSSVYSVLNNWASLVRDIGITVIVYPPTVKYEYVFEGDPSTPFSRFSNRLRVNVSLDVFSVNAGYKHFVKNKVRVNRAPYPTVPDMCFHSTKHPIIFIEAIYRNSFPCDIYTSRYTTHHIHNKPGTHQSPASHWRKQYRGLYRYHATTASNLRHHNGMGPHRDPRETS
ncbi:hypothetical protein [Desulfurococcus amylolyticus]|uniref:hypothetical protein n=1 Tax=Desulfurococcus amylolyticus TaxID=94694 RepID=UPI000AABD6F6|nr:hypothetical protein [Desulfurococcus amylolyticus]